ncbi:MAG TPA: phage tail protein [Candidatus Limosilactobacillus excrementigallinarum]|nr:phage tail protein [Candidatus Limosilactobacillus excrementigallinarum]
MTDKLVVRGLKRTEKEPLRFTAIDPDSFYVEWSMNTSWTLQFTIKDDGSIGYNMLDAEASLFWDGQEYIIKQCTPTASGEVDGKDIVATHVYTEVGRIRKYKQYIDPNDPSAKQDHDVKVAQDNSGSDDDQGQKTEKTTKNGNTTTKTTVTKTDETKQETENQKMYSIEDVLKFFLDGNQLGFTYEVIGKFDKARIAEITDGTGTDMLSKITEAWPNAVIYPDNRKIRVYSLDEFQKDYGNRLDYEYNTTEFKLTYDATSLTNVVYCIGGRYSVQTDTETSTDTSGSGGPGADKVVADAKKYLGVPYRWGGPGGARGGNPFDGMDCSSFVSQVYKDFGINIPAYTVSMEPYFHQVSTPQTGDVGFYGPHGGSTHICLMLNSNTMIYEPDTGDVCKIRPVSVYPPSWYARNDQMASIVAGGSSGSDNDGGDSQESSKTDEYYYFAPFFAKVQKSIDMYGEYPADPIEDGRFRDRKAMEQYAISKLQPDPALSVEVSTYSDFKPIPGDKVHCMVDDFSLSTNLAVVGFQWYPFSKSNYTSVTLNTNAQNILDYQHSHQIKLDKAIQDISTTTTDIENGLNKGVWTQAEVNTFGSNFNND